MTISIITPSLNQGPYLREALESVRAQGFESAEHIVLDGGSTDCTLRRLQGLRKQPGWSHLHWQSRSDRGQSSALNRGFEMATGDIVGWLNADDRYRPGCFQHVAEAFRANPEVDVFYGDYALINEAGQPTTIRHEIEFNRFILTYHRVLYIPTASTFFRARIFRDGIRLREHLHYAMDYELFLRLANLGYHIRHTHSVLAEFRVHPQSKSIRYRERQLAERRQILYSSLPSAAGLAATTSGRTLLHGLEWAAGAMRCSQKLLRGAYFTRTQHDAQSTPKEHPCAS